MRILFVTHNYSPAIGGAEMIAKENAERLAKTDEVTVFTSNATSGEGYIDPRVPLLPPTTEIVRGVRVRRFRVWRRWIPLFGKYADLLWRRRYPFHDIARLVYNGPHMPGMAGALLKEKADVLIAIPFPFLNVYYAFLVGKLRRIPLLIIPCMHVEDPWSFDREIMYRVLRSADLILPNTKQTTGVLVAHGVKPERIIPVGAGIDPSFLRPADGAAFRRKHGLGEAPVILFVGRKIQPKGIGMLLEAMREVWQRTPKARLVVAGTSTPYWKDLWSEFPREARTKILSIDDFAESEKPNLYDACDVFAMPSLVDSFGITFLEAWAFNKPVVGLRAGGVPGLIEDGVDGLLVEKGDVPGLSEALLSILRNRTGAARMGRAGREKLLRHHTWDAVAERLRIACRLAISAKKNGTLV